MNTRPIAYLTARGLSVEEVSQAYAIVSELEGQAEPNLREMSESLRNALPGETWSQVVRLLEAYRDMAVQCSLVALSRGLRQGAVDFLEKLGPPPAETSADIPNEEELKEALTEARVGNRIISLSNNFGLDPVEVVYAQAVGSAIEGRYESQDEVLLQNLVMVGDAVRSGETERQDVERAFNMLADLSSRKLAEMLVAAYAVGRQKGSRSEWERIRQRVTELW